MKKVIAFTIALGIIALCYCAAAAATNDYIWSQKPASGPLVSRNLAPTVGRLVGFPTSINSPETIIIGSGLTLTGSTLTASGGGGGSGTVTSVALSAPAILAVAGSPVTTSGTIALSLASQSANRVFAGPTTGADATPTFRALVADDIPSLSSVYQPLASALTTLSSATAAGLALMDDADNTAQRATLGLGDLAALSAVASAQITDSTIVNADISASAAIALSKLATDPLARANHTGTQAWSTLTSTPTTLAGYGISDAQPLDSDLTSIAALVTTTVGRSFLAASFNGSGLVINSTYLIPSPQAGVTNGAGIGGGPSIFYLDGGDGNVGGGNGGNGGELLMSGGDGVGATPGANAGSINTSAFEDLPGGSIDTSGGGGSITTTAGGSLTTGTGNINTGNANGTLATLAFASSVALDSQVTGTLPVANGGTGITAFGSGVATALGVNVGGAGAVVVNGGALGTPSSGTLTNATGLPPAGVTGTAAITGGANTFTAAQMVDGSADAIQLLVQGHTTQTSSPLVVEKSDGTNVFEVTNDGRLEGVADPGFPQFTATNKTTSGMRVYSDRVDFWENGSVLITLQSGTITMNTTAFTAGYLTLGLSGGATGPVIRAGSGSPEGVITAPVGSIYTDSANGDLYRKTSGTGNTGWVTP